MPPLTRRCCLRSPQQILHGLLEYNETYTEELQDKSGEVREITGAWLANLHRDKKKILSDWKDTRKRMDSDVKVRRTC